MTSKTELYDRLSVPKTATIDEIKKAFKKLAIQYHPDKCINADDKKQREEMFKQINEAYSVLSDPEKKARYDQFGEVNGQNGGGMNMDDILREIFGDSGFPNFGGNMGGGFSFVFMDGGSSRSHSTTMPSMPPQFEAMFGGGGGGSMGQPRMFHKVDTIDVTVDINDIYYGETKKVEFEILEQCEQCKGSGAQDPSHVLNCMTCHGNGVINQQIGPFFTQSMTCQSCMGQGTTVQHNKFCLKCKGSKTLYNKKIFELKLPKGLPNHYEVMMEGKGAYNKDTKQSNDIRFRFIYNIQEPYKIDKDMNVHYKIDVTLEELLGGFRKDISIYRETITLVNDYYFNPNKQLIVHNYGLYDMRAEKHSDLIIHFNIVFNDNDRFRKYADVMKKILKLSPVTTKEENTNLIKINEHL